MNFAYGVPVTFDSFGGLYHVGAVDRKGRKAVLLLSPIGYEELCTRATWRALAEMIATAGHACLRFDYPRTADAIDGVGEPEGIADWLAAARRCMSFLREQNPGRELVLVGQGLGASLAAQLGAEASDIAGTALMAPVVKGRNYLRELQAWSRMVTERIGIGPDPVDDNGYNVAGMSLASSRVTAIKAIDLTRAAQPPAARILLVERSQMPQGSAIANSLKALGADVTAIDYAGYEQILEDPTPIEPQLGTLARIVSWIDDLPQGPEANLPAPPLAPAKPIIGAHYEELPVRFGPDQRLFGIVCQPLGQKPSAVAILANSGRDYHIGWGRAAVEQARALAGRGVASLRFDGGGIGDSPASADAPAEVLYSDDQIVDLRHAIDYVERLDAGPIAVVGRCSGAYGAFQVGVQDARVGTVVAINIMRFVWDPRETVADALQSAHRTVGGSLALLFSRQSLRRLLSGNLRLKAPIMFFAKRLARAILSRQNRAGEGQPAIDLVSEGHRRFQVLDNRGGRLAILAAEGDHSLGEFRTYMGRRGRRMRRYANASISIIPDADHNFTHTGARARLTEALCDVLASTKDQPAIRRLPGSTREKITGSKEGTW